MSATQISTSVTIINSLLGFQAISLTEFDTSAESSIAAGSKVEIASAFFTFSADEAISGFSAITTGENAFVALTPAGTAGSQTVTAAWTDAAPIWDDAKQGWYASAGSSTRYVANAVKTSTTGCEGAHILPTKHGELAVLHMNMGTWNMDATTSITVYYGVAGAAHRSVGVVIFRDTSTAIYYGSPIIWEDGNSELGIPGNNDSWNSTSNDLFTITRRTSGFFDSTSFNDTAINRGIVTVSYVVEDA